MFIDSYTLEVSLFIFASLVHDRNIGIIMIIFQLIHIYFLIINNSFINCLMFMGSVSMDRHILTGVEVLLKIIKIICWIHIFVFISTYVCIFYDYIHIFCLFLGFFYHVIGQITYFFI